MGTTVRNKSAVWSTGLAMFAMFFGAGNIVFPLALGQFVQDKSFYGIMGLVVTAVLVPLMGLLAMMLYNGDYLSFFRRIGKVPGFLVALLILGLIGPFGGIPRCITISYSTLNAFGFEAIKGVNLMTFSLVSCVLIFLFTYRPTKIISLLGYVLTPILLLSLAVIVAKGLMVMPHPDPSMHTRWSSFSQGLFDGYNTMDLLAAFFFSSVVLLCLRKDVGDMTPQENRRLRIVAVLGSLIAALLLAVVYISFSFLAAGYSNELESVASHELLGTLAYHLLGPYAGMIAGVAVCFACLTTEIALTAVFAEFLHETIFKEKVPYTFSLVFTLFVSFLVSTLHFEGISSFLVPILKICYPALIVLSILNILNKAFDFKPVKRVFYGTVALTFITYIFV